MMDGDTLGTAIKDALVTGGYVVAGGEAETEAIWQVIAGAIVAHISANAVVASGIPVEVDTGTGVGATTGTGTVG